MKFLGRAIAVTRQWIRNCAQVVSTVWQAPARSLVEEVGHAVAGVVFATADLYRMCCQVPYAVLVLLRALLALRRILWSPSAPPVVPDRIVCV